MEMQGESRATISKPGNVKDCPSPRELGEEHRADSPSEPPEGTNPTHPGVWTCGLHNCERVNFCYLKPLGLWQFVIASLENKILKASATFLFHKAFSPPEYSEEGERWTQGQKSGDTNIEEKTG